jgi:hypothetical protein
MKKINELTRLALLAAAVSVPPVTATGALPYQPFTERAISDDQNGDKSQSITFPRSSGGITEIAIERLDFPNAYVTMVTTSGPTRDEAAMAAATLLTFTELKPQTSFAATNSITFFYNQSKPGYVISELERARLISPAEAEAARSVLRGTR